MAVADHVRTDLDPSASQNVLPDGWAFFVLFYGFPIWWALGVGTFIWPVLCLPIIATLLLRKDVVVPRGFGLWVALCLFVVASAVQLDNMSRVAGWALRTTYYLGAGALLLYLVNGTRKRLSSEQIVRTMAVFFLFVVVGGYLGLMFPHVRFEAPIARYLPPEILSNELIHDVVNPGLAEVQWVGEMELRRPRAPFVYTNGWGSGFAILAPLAIAAIQINRKGTRQHFPSRRLLGWALVAGSVPALLSLNRGLWLSLGAGMLYAGVLRFRALGRRNIKRILGALAVVGVLVMVSPIPDQVSASMETRAEDSDDTRTALYEETVERTKASPFLGFGAPRPSEEVDQSAGTHGQIWLVTFSHGFIAAGLYLLFFLVMCWRTRPPTTGIGFWAHVSLVIGTMQVFFYGHLPHQLFFMMAIAAVGLREREKAIEVLTRSPATQAG
jgi:polysaccharide biosynthesis protein PslJ